MSEPDHQTEARSIRSHAALGTPHSGNTLKLGISVPYNVIKPLLESVVALLDMLKAKEVDVKALLATFQYVKEGLH